MQFSNAYFECDAHLLNILEEAEPAEGLVTTGTHLHHSSAPQASHTLKTCEYIIVKGPESEFKHGGELMAKKATFLQPAFVLESQLTRKLFITGENNYSTYVNGICRKLRL